MNYIDLFAGAGGLSEGFIENGFNPIAHIEMNHNAVLTLRTRKCYHYLKEIGKLEIYKNYLQNKISRDDLYNYVPKSVLDSVIETEITDDTIENIFNNVDKLLGNKKLDVIVGGPPCQAYSNVGRSVKKDKMVGDPRNYLYIQYCHFLQKYKPKMFVFENVPGLLTANNGEHFRNLQKSLMDVGYEVNYKKINAKDFGVLQNRQRIILIGWQKGLPLRYPEFDLVKHNYKVNDLLSDLPLIEPGQEKNDYKKMPTSYLTEFGIRGKDDILTLNVARPHLERDREIYRKAINAWNDGHKRLHYNELPSELKNHKNESSFLDRFKIVEGDTQFCHTMMAHIAKDGHYFIHPDVNQARSLTVREAARIQSFPDNYYFEGGRTAAYTQIGNAVPPLMAKAIAKKIKEELK